MRCMPALTLTVAFALTGAATAAQQEDWRKARPSGKPESCVQIQQIRETRVRDDRTIDFYMRGGKVYRNTLPQTCPRLGFERRFSYRTSLNRLCSVDIITVLLLTPPQRGAFCGLGQFQPVTGAPA